MSKFGAGETLSASAELVYTGRAKQQKTNTGLRKFKRVFLAITNRKHNKALSLNES